MKLYKPSWIHHDGHPIFSIDIHPDDTHCATGGQGDDNTGRVVIWNLKAVLADINDDSIPRQFCKLDHHSACVNCVRWSNSGHYLASGGDDKVIIVWKLVSKYSSNNSNNNNNNINSAFETNNLEHWKTVCILRSHDGDVLDLSWSPRDTYLASCSIDNSVKIWDAQNFPQIIATLEGHSSMVKGVTWDPVGKYIATQSVDRTLRIWRTSDWSTEHVVSDPFVDCGGTTHVLRLGWSPDGLYLVSAHAMNYGFPTAQIIERDGWKIDKDFVGHRKAVVCVRFNKNIQENNGVKQCCVALGSRDRSISVWSTALKRPVVVVKDAFSHSVMDLTWSHCGTVMMACSWDGSVLAAQFNWKEIGRPLSQEETDSLYQRFYGNSIVMTNTLNVIPNMEVYLARQKAAANKISEIKSSEVKSATAPTPVPTPVPVTPPIVLENKVAVKPMQEKPEEQPMECENSVSRGPAKQIETRTADGKRRITPKFLPLPLDPDQPNPVNAVMLSSNVITAEEMKPPPPTTTIPIIANVNVKKKFTPQSLRTFPIRKNNRIETNNEENAAVVENHNSVPIKTTASNKSASTPKTRLAPMKIDTVSTLQVNIKPEIAYNLEVLNRHRRPDGLCHQLRCKHFPTSLQGLEWVICTDAPICGITGDMHRIIALCEDATIHVFDLKGRYAMSPVLLSSYPSKHVQSGAFLAVITTKGYLNVWNIHQKKVVIKSESLLPLLNQPVNESCTGDKAIDIAHIYLGESGVPVVFLSNGKSFIFNKDMGSWTLFSDSRGLVSSPMMPDVEDLAAVASINKIWGRQKRPEPAVVSHIKLQLIRAIELRKSTSIQQWIIVLAKTLATHGLDKELHILCEDLLGPTHSSAKSGTTWNPKLGDCVDKRVMLREILNGLLEDLRWQDFYCEFDELLNELQESNSMQ